MNILCNPDINSEESAQKYAIFLSTRTQVFIYVHSRVFFKLYAQKLFRLWLSYLHQRPVVKIHEHENGIWVQHAMLHVINGQLLHRAATQLAIYGCSAFAYRQFMALKLILLLQFFTTKINKCRILSFWKSNLHAIL